MIEQYLAELRMALAGADPALVQDALYDAEEYLRAEMADGTDEASFAAAIERYGSPEEVAQAYRETEVTVARALQAPAPKAPKGKVGGFFGVLIDPRAYGSLFYLFFAFVMGIAYFTFVSVLLPLSVSLIPAFVGLPLLVGFFAAVRAISLAEGRVVESMLGVRMPRRPRIAYVKGDWISRVKFWFTDGRTWTTLLYMVLQLPLGIMYFSLGVAAITVSTVGVVWPIAQLFTDYPLIQMGGYGYVLQPWATPIAMLGGVLCFVITLHLVRLIGKGHAIYAKAMLVGRYSDTPEQAAA